LADEDQGVILNMKNLQRETPLHWAAAGGKIDTLEYLLFRGFDVNAKSANGWTPLICALSPTLKHQYHDAQAKQPWEAVQAAQLLLFHGADPLVSTAEGWAPMHCLARYQDGDDRSDLAQLAKQLILCGADIEARATMLSQGIPEQVHPNKTVNSLRHCEFAWGSEVQEMMELTAGKRGFVRPGLTPLHCAAEHGALGVAKTLLSYGADASAKDPSGSTPAQMAREATLLPASLQLKEKLVQLFIEAGGT
jgi:ankyrin repeat protein